MIMEKVKKFIIKYQNKIIVLVQATICFLFALKSINNELSARFKIAQKTAQKDAKRNEKLKNAAMKNAKKLAKGELKRGDRYLLCSDGLTDMLTNLEIDEIMSSTETAGDCVQKLIDAALEKGGKDNVTAIVCRIL